jgi:hypothetical protein
MGCQSHNWAVSSIRKLKSTFLSNQEVIIEAEIQTRKTIRNLIGRQSKAPIEPLKMPRGLTACLSGKKK